MKIAICDDNQIQLELLVAFLEEYAQTHYDTLSFFPYKSSVELASVLSYSTYDLYLLDVLMPALNGIDLAKEIRAVDRAADLIFLTSSPEFAVDSYTVKASNYLLKPIQKEALFHALDEILEKRREEKEQVIILKSTIGVHKISLSSITCVEALNRKIIYYLRNGEQLECAERFASVCDRLTQYPEFILPHRSFLVNMNYIRSITNTDLILADGKNIPLAQRRVAEIKKHYLAFQMKEADT